MTEFTDFIVFVVDPSCEVPATPAWVRPPCKGKRVFSPVAAVPVGTKLAATRGSTGGAILAIGWPIGNASAVPAPDQN